MYSLRAIITGVPLSDAGSEGSRPHLGSEGTFCQWQNEKVKFTDNGQAAKAMLTCPVVSRQRLLMIVFALVQSMRQQGMGKWLNPELSHTWYVPCWFVWNMLTERHGLAYPP